MGPGLKLLLMILRRLVLSPPSTVRFHQLKTTLFTKLIFNTFLLIDLLILFLLVSLINKNLFEIIDEFNEYLFEYTSKIPLEDIEKAMKEQQKVIKRIQDLKKEYQECEDKKKFEHRCPFLDEDGVCTVYEYRGMICRTFGLITMLDDGGCVIPFCQELGLNYSNVYDPINKRIDMEKVKKLGFKNIPHPRKTSLKTIMSPEMFEGESPIDFGERKALIEWL